MCGVLNSPSLTMLVRPLMSHGKNERNVDKVVWQLPIPAFDSQDAEHQRIAELGASCAQLIAALDIDEGGNFVTERRKVRAALATSEVGQALDEIVQELLAWGGVPVRAVFGDMHMRPSHGLGPALTDRLPGSPP